VSRTVHVLLAIVSMSLTPGRVRPYGDAAHERADEACKPTES
jgi:hypothetical protein